MVGYLLDFVLFFVIRFWLLCIMMLKFSLGLFDIKMLWKYILFSMIRKVNFCILGMMELNILLRIEIKIFVWLILELVK